MAMTDEPAFSEANANRHHAESHDHDDADHSDAAVMGEHEAIERIAAAKTLLLSQDSLTLRRAAQLAGVPLYALHYAFARAAVSERVKEIRAAKVKARITALEDEWCRKVHEAYEELARSGKEVSETSICASLGISLSYLQHYPRALTELRKFAITVGRQPGDVNIDEAVAIARAQELAAEAAGQQRRLTQADFAQALGIPLGSLTQMRLLHSEVKTLIADQRRSEAKRLQEESLDAARRACVELEFKGFQPTKSAVARMIGKSVTYLNRRPEIQEFFEQILERRRQSAPSEHAG